MRTVDQIVSVLAVIGVVVAPAITGKRNLFFLAVTAAATLFTICTGNLYLLCGYAAGALLGAAWKA